MKRCGVCGTEYDGEASKDGASYRIVHQDTVEYVYECYLCHNITDSRIYPRTRPGTRKPASNDQAGSAGRKENV